MVSMSRERSAAWAGDRTAVDSAYRGNGTERDKGLGTRDRGKEWTGGG